MLDVNLDPTTLEVVNSSHPLSLTTVISGNLVSNQGLIALPLCYASVWMIADRDVVPGKYFLA